MRNYFWFRTGRIHAVAVAALWISSVVPRTNASIVWSDGVGTVALSTSATADGSPGSAIVDNSVQFTPSINYSQTTQVGLSTGHAEGSFSVDPGGNSGYVGSIACAGEANANAIAPGNAGGTTFSEAGLHISVNVPTVYRLVGGIRCEAPTYNASLFFSAIPGSFYSSFSTTGVLTPGQEYALGGVLSFSAARDYPPGTGPYTGEVGAVLTIGGIAGDADRNGRVDSDDYFLIDRGYSRSAHDWSDGDFNLDEIVNGDDYFIIDSAYSPSPAPLPLTSAVPEPASLALLCAGALALRRRSRARAPQG